MRTEDYWFILIGIVFVVGAARLPAACPRAACQASTAWAPSIWWG